MLILGDARSLPIRDGTVQCVITSPPYWGLRDYKLEPLVWGGEGCTHVWGEERQRAITEQTAYVTGRAAGEPRAPARKLATIGNILVSQGAFCSRCPAWRGSLGLEPSPDLYVKHLVGIFREIRRVLREDGTVWLNLGDSYTSGDRSTYRSGVSDNKGHLVQNDQARPKTPLALKPKGPGRHPLARGLRAPGGRLVAPRRDHLGQVESHARVRHRPADAGA